MMSMDSIMLVDTNEESHKLTKFQVRVMMAVGWTAFLGSWLMDILFYKVHPSSVDFSEKGMREKLFIHVQGEKRFLWGYRNRDAEGEKYFFVRCLIIFLQTKHREHRKCLRGEILL